MTAGRGGRLKWVRELLVEFLSGLVDLRKGGGTLKPSSQELGRWDWWTWWVQKQEQDKSWALNFASKWCHYLHFVISACLCGFPISTVQTKVLFALDSALLPPSFKRLVTMTTSPLNQTYKVVRRLRFQYNSSVRDAWLTVTHTLCQ